MPRRSRNPEFNFREIPKCSFLHQRRAAQSRLLPEQCECTQRFIIRPAAQLAVPHHSAIAPLEAVVSYSHHDEKLRDKLDRHLCGLKRQGLIATWYDRKISPGTDFDLEISNHLETADLVLLLISAEFIASDYCWSQEMTKALARHTTGEARVIPIILRPCDWRNTPLGKLLALPTDGKPVASSAWPNADSALSNIAEGLRKTVDELLAGGGRYSHHHASGT